VVHRKIKNRAIDAGVRLHSSSGSPATKASLNTKKSFLGYAVFTHASKSRHTNSKAVIQFSVLGKCKMGLMFATNILMIAKLQFIIQYFNCGTRCFPPKTSICFPRF
jgi:hypothetical protein